MTVRLTHELFAALLAEGERRGLSPADTARAVLSENLPPAPDHMPVTDKQRRRREMATDCGAGHPPEAYGREEIYD